MKEEEQAFTQPVAKREDIDVVLKALGKSEDIVFIRLRRLESEVVDGEKINCLLLLQKCLRNC